MARKGRGKQGQVRVARPFIRTNPKGSEVKTKVFPEALTSVKRRTMVEVEAWTG